MNSMTGFGRARLSSPLGQITVELSSVNNRFLELSVRMPRAFAALEPQVRELVSGSVGRGKVTINVDLALEKGSATTHVDKTAARAVHRELNALKKELKLAGDISVSDLLAFEEVFASGREEIDTDKAWPVLKRALEKGVERLVHMRETEGAALARDMQARLKVMEKAIAKIESSTKNSVEIYAAKLARRVKELMAEPVDSRRLEEEIAIFAERTDIAEECTRFRSHLDQYRAALSQKDAAGRKLNFILQEMNREVNTIGSKSADFSIAGHVISLKEELEKLREQVQNIE
ncbi:MAG: YicC family protein [candidate division Zixibacteria bacterium]|nr:YicC family protein [candidate division Zixibacteria bacterium]